MELGGLLDSDWLYWAVFGGVAALAWVGWTRDVRRVVNTFRLMGRRLEAAEVHRARWSIAYPTLTFRHSGSLVTVNLSQGGERFPPKTTFTISLPRPLPFSVKLWRESVVEKLGKAVGVKDIQVGDQKFDEAFLVRGSSEDQVRSLLDPKLRAALLWFKDLEPWVTAKDREVEVEICTIPGDRGLFERFFSLGKLATDAAVRELG